MGDNLLISEPPLQVLPSLAKEIGLNEGIILQQIHYWLRISKHYYDGLPWIYNTYDGWVEQFPFWSQSTIKRAIKSLEKQNLIYIGNYNKAGFDNTKWYSINYESLEKLMNKPSGQNDQTNRSKWTDGTGQNDQTYTRDYTENTTERENARATKENKKQKQRSELLNLYQEKIGQLSPNDIQDLYSWLDDLNSEEQGYDIIAYAIEESEKKDAYSYNYLRSKLRAYNKDDVDTLDKAKIHEKKRNRKNGKSKKSKDAEKKISFFDELRGV